MVLKFGHFGKYIKNTWEVLQCGAGEGRRRQEKVGEGRRR